jgi:enamine deaminase RidA (YjgF/YER057c/UK114 family)
MKLSSNETQTIHKTNTDGMNVTTFSSMGLKHYYILSHPAQNDFSKLVSGKFSKELNIPDLQILSQFVFGGSEMESNGMPQIEQYAGNNNWPTTYIHGDISSNGLLYGSQMYAISGCSAFPVYLNGRLAGSFYEDDNAEYCILGDIRPDNKNLSREEQSLQTFEDIEKALKSVNMEFTDIVRTWFYIDRLLDWYPEFNAIRTKFFDEKGVFGKLIPASTGIGCGNLQGALLVANVLAIKPKHDGVRILPVASPMQCDATDYRSSFSRAVEIQFPHSRHLFISGTASIDIDGNSANIGDVRRQIELTMKVVEAIIVSRNMQWNDSVRGIAYFKDINDTKLFVDYCRQHNLLGLPVSFTQSDICRDDLLFELEIDLLCPDIK